MVFNKTGGFIKCDHLTINSVKDNKYLGFIITTYGEILTGLKDLHSRDAYTLVQLRKRLGENFINYPDVTLHLFDVLVKPIIMYISDFCRCLNMPKKQPD